MSADGEAFLSRWSRLKRAEARKPEAPAGAAADATVDDEPPPLPPIESLTPESDFTAFMHAKVPDVLRRAALKKLFADPMFGGIDPNEAYSGDWTGGGELPEEMLKTLHQAKRVLFDEPPPPPVRDEEPESPQAQGEPAATIEERPEEASQSMPPQAEKAGDGRA